MNWNDFERLKCFPQNCNCEPMRFEHLILQPIAVLTSLPFIILGLFYIRSEKDFHLRVLLGLFIVLGFSSIFLHSSFILISNFFDFGSIFAIISWTLSYLYFKKKSNLTFFLTLIGLTILSTLGIYFFPHNPVGVFAGYFIPAVIAIGFKLNQHRPTRKNIVRFFRAVLLIILGGACFILDRQKVFCYNNIYTHGHSIWHLLVAVALYEQYKFFKEYK
ncbi:ceramidase domain-containing protein [Bacteriovorax sp. Seq25_V]|uniref:ceramidase domain-containing protein n=1 Tax=Bacteriovorax sp. Seq25_V TaxID=1201288 RepID=UPI000550AB9E|nr:ceramidase domain-containing protein [Bacteriovorax sp. Seq25_V]